MSTLLSVSIALLGGLLMTRIFKPLKLPSVTAYLIAGVLIGPYCLGQLGVHGLGFDSAEAVHALKLVSDADLSYSLVSMRKLPDNRLKMEFAVSFMENFNMFEFVKNAAENEFVEAVYSE